MQSKFRETLRSEMDFQDVKVKELAQKTKISQRTLEGYLSARGSIPPADVAVKIASALGVTVEYLITGIPWSSLAKKTTLNNKVEISFNELSIGKKMLVKEFIRSLVNFEVEKK